MRLLRRSFRTLQSMLSVETACVPPLDASARSQTLFVIHTIRRTGNNVNARMNTLVYLRARANPTRILIVAVLLGSDLGIAYDFTPLCDFGFDEISEFFGSGKSRLGTVRCQPLPNIGSPHHLRK